LENDFFGAVFLQQTAHTVTAGNCMCAHVMLMHCKFDKNLQSSLTLNLFFLITWHHVKNSCFALA